MDLSGLFAGNVLNIELDRMLGTPSQGPDGFPHWPLWHGLVRLTDQAISSHEAARANLAEWLTSGKRSTSLRAVNNLEQCVFATHRAMLMAKALNKKLGRSAWPTKAERASVRDLRDAILHTDERLTGASAPRYPPFTASDPPVLTPQQDHMVLGRCTLTYSELGQRIRGCYDMIESVRGAPSA